MKRGLIISGIILSLILVFGRCSSEKKFKVQGKFKVTDPTPVRLYYLTEQNSQLIDSVKSVTGSFTLTGKISFAGIYLLKFYNDQSIYLVIHPGDRINVDIDNAGSEISYYVENSPDSKRIKELSDKQNLVLRQIDELSKDWESNRSDTSMRRKIDSAYMSLLHRHKQYTESFIYEDPKSLANIMALYQNFGRKTQPLFDRYDDFNIFNFVDSNLVLLYPETEAVKALNREVNETGQEIKDKKYIEKIVAEGRPFPDFKYPDIHGDTLQITQTYNKPVVLYFWASWNPYSVTGLLELNNFYSNPALKSITIITISLDTSEEELKAFLNSKNIILPVVCDYTYWDSDIVGRYGIKHIPASIIRSKQGLISGIDILDKELITRIKDMAQ